MRYGMLRLKQLARASTVLLAVPAVFPATAWARAPGEGKPSLLGSYLAGRIARGQHDTEAASKYYASALARDPGNEALMDQALLMHAAEGRFSEAIALSRQLVVKQPTHRMATLVLALEEAKAGNYAAAEERFKASAVGVMGEVTSALARAWMLAAQGNLKAATDLLDGIKQAEWTQFFLRYHKALISDIAGKKPEARALYERVFRGESKSVRIALAYAQHASNGGDQKLARTVMDEHVRRAGTNLHPIAKALSDHLKGPERTVLLIENPLEGLAEVFYGLGEALAAEGPMASVGAIYLQMALYLKPDAPFALAALASFFEGTKKFTEANAAYDRIPKGTALQGAVEIRKALNLNSMELPDNAKRVLETLAVADPTDIKPLDALGNIMRSRKRYEEAADYYSKVIALIGPKPDKKHWTYFYARGTSYERLKRWPLAEADLQKALQLSPDEPLVLNYLGYSWVDQNKNLRQGLTLIEKAVAKKPDDGYIVDSLGWAHYRLGNYKEAVRYLERAVELRPEDPVLNDHLGDAFWRVGRLDEARFQWEQSLTLKPEPDEIEKITRKISNGLPAKPAPRVTKKEPSKTEAPKKRTESKVGTQRPAVE